MSDQPFSLPTNSQQRPPAPPPRIPSAPPAAPQAQPVQPPQQAAPFNTTENEWYEDPQPQAEYYEDAYTEEEAIEEDGVFWQVVQWSEDEPFRGALVFTDQNNTVLAAVPVEPEAMKSLNDITGYILDEQFSYVNNGQERPVEETKRTQQAQVDSKGRKQVKASPMGIPIQLSVNTKSLTIVGVILAVMLLGILTNIIVN